MPDRAESPSWGQKPRYGEFEIVGAREDKPRVLGEGSFGKTFEAVRTDTVAGGVIEERVAIKVLNPALLASESRRFQVIQELVALTKFKHSNLIHYIRCGEEEGEVYYAMELCRGGDLTRLVRRYRVLPEKVAALIGVQVATGLREVHQRHGLVHRDIKPSNIMLVDEIEPGLGVARLAERLEEQEGLCRVVDFGLVSFALNSKETHQKFVGSPMYASPEQISEQALDGRSDIYSLGMTLWFLVQGKGPLLDASGNDLKGVRDVMRRHTLTEEHASSFPPHLSDEFRRILAKMVTKRPEERYASAADVQHALRDYLRTEAVYEETRFSVIRLAEPLTDVFVLEEKLPSRSPHVSHIGRRKSTGERVKLTILTGTAERPDAAVLAAHYCNVAELTHQPAKPETLLQVREVIWAADLLAFTEEWEPHLTLAEVVNARSRAGRPIDFAEAMALLRPIAEALDFLIEHGQNAVYLPGEEIWLTASAAPDADAAIDPLTPLTELQPHFSMVCLPEAHGSGANVVSSMQETLSASMHLSDFDVHPVPSFARLIYYLLSGAEVAAAAQYTPSAYVPTANLKPSSNDMIRNLICRQDVWTHATMVLRDLCAHQGLVWQQPALAISTQRGTASVGTSPSAATSSSAHRSANLASGSGSEGWPRETAGPEKVCEVISPGVVRSPYDPERRTQEMPADQWVPSGRVRCQFTQRTFRLPRKLDMLRAGVVAAGVIHSPYAAPDVTQAVPWEEWVPGGEIVCAESGRRITLPQSLPMPEGILVAHHPGTILSPYDRSTSIAIPPERWEPGAGVMCPVTQSQFLLPRELPPLEALADASRPGILATPYASTRTWQMEAVDWVAEREVKCPVSGKPLRLPQLVERWPAETRVVDASRRLIRNPYAPESTVQVPAASWLAGATVPCPQSGRTILLPADLPPLTGEIVEDRPGVVRSPYSGEIVSVPPKDWICGIAVTCPRTQLRFMLPGQLPGWIPTANISDLAPGKARSPYEPFPEIQVLPEEWMPNQTLKCPETGRLFRLPTDLPSLEGKVKSGRPAKVTSPFSGTLQEVPLDDWKPGQRLECAKTSRTFRLPAVLPEWLPDGEWVPGCPGRIRSPYHPHPEVDLTPEQWRSGQVLNCPSTGRRFRVPVIDSFPTLGLEKEAVQYALAEPESAETDAADALQRQHRSATAALVKTIWERHDLETAEKRQRNVQIAEALPGEPGFVRSPYGSRSKVEVPPALWAEQGASMLCPETGRRFLLPTNRSSLVARLVPGELGRLISPYRPDEPFHIPPEHWQPGRSIVCEHTGHPLQLPPNLPAWLPEGTLKQDQPGLAFSPFGRCGVVRIPGSNWFAGAEVTCLETGRIFVLPAKVPPLVATVDEDQLGQIVSPYARDRKVRVPHRLWKPGARLICPETKRIYLLPETLPVWNRRPFPWKQIAVSAACVALAAGGWFSWSHLGGFFLRSKSPAAPGHREGTAATAQHAGQSRTPEEEILDAAPQARRVIFAGGLDIEEWPAEKDPPKGLRLIHGAKEVPLKMDNNQLTAILPSEADDQPGAGVELRLPGWKPLKLELPAPPQDKLFQTQSTPILPVATDLNTPAAGIVRVQERKKLERQRVSLPASIIPDGGTDYAYLDALWVGRLSQEPDAAPPPVNPIRLPVIKGQIERALPTGIYDFTLRGAASDKLNILPYVWKAGVKMSSQEMTLYPLPRSLAADYLGLLFTVRNKDKKLEGGYFFSMSVAPKLASVKAMVNPLAIKGGEIISYPAVKADKDELGVIENLRLTDPNTLEFDASLRMFDYHWTFKVEENGTRFMYGQLVEFKSADFERIKMRMEQMFREKAHVARVAPIAADRLGSIPVDQYRSLYAENLKEAMQKAQYLTETYPDMKVKSSSIYFGLHSASEVVRVVHLTNGDWDLQKDPR